MSMSNCEMCGTLNEGAMGDLGSREWYRCRYCGWDYSVEKSKNKYNGVEPKPENYDEREK